MSEWTAEELAEFTTAFQGLTDALALALSESFNNAFRLDAPVASLEPLDGLMASAEAVLQTTFAYPLLSADECLLVFDSKDAAILADLAAGGDGSAPPAALVESHVETLSNALNGVVQGFGIAIGNALQQEVEPGACTTTLEALSLPGSLSAAGQAIQVVVPFHVEGLLDGTLRLFFSPDLAAILAPRAVSTAADSAAEGAEEAGAAEGDGMIDQSELDRLMAEVGSGEETDTNGAYGGQAAPTMPAGPASHAFEPFDMLGGAPEVMPRGMDLIMDIPLDVTVELGRVRMLIKDVLELATGSIVELERVAGEPVDLLVNGRLVAKGEVVVIEDNFGIRITEIVSPADRLNGVGARA